MSTVTKELKEIAERMWQDDLTYILSTEERFAKYKVVDELIQDMFMRAGSTFSQYLGEDWGEESSLRYIDESTEGNHIDDIDDEELITLETFLNNESCEIPHQLFVETLIREYMGSYIFDWWNENIDE